MSSIIWVCLCIFINFIICIIFNNSFLVIKYKLTMVFIVAYTAFIDQNHSITLNENS